MKIVVKTLFGLEKVLAAELQSLGAGKVEIANRAVITSGNKELLYKINYCSRTALSVLKIIEQFRIGSKDDLYKKASEIRWSEIMDVGNTFSIVPVVNSRFFNHSGYPALVVKDAIADYFRKKSGKRPSVNSTDPDLLINLHISNEKVNISLDSSVIPLFQRGYRMEHTEAPLNELLAAGILMISGWDCRSPLVDPMCGSGTIPIEAGLIASGIPPGSFRKFFGFFRWKDYDPLLFRQVVDEASNHICKPVVSITGSDVSGEAIRISTSNINRAGLSDIVKTSVSDFQNLVVQENAGYLFINPPYGQRLKTDDPGKLYSMIGSTMKHNFAGYKAWIITSGMEYLNNIGLRPFSKLTLYNGPLECILAGYDLFEGKRRRAAGDTSS